MATYEEVSEIVELPAIAIGGQVNILNPDMRKLDNHDLRLLAKTLEGQLVYVKKRIKYEDPELPLCTVHDCWRPASDALGCTDHPGGKHA